MKVVDTQFFQEYIAMGLHGDAMGWHERNGGNMTYWLTAAEAAEVSAERNEAGEWRPVGTAVPDLAGEYFLVTGTGKYLHNLAKDPEGCTGIIRLDDKGENYRIVWGFAGGGRPTSELPTHLMNMEVRSRRTGGQNRVIYHAHCTNLIALTFLLPLEDEIFSRELWEMMTECPVIFPEGLGVVEWMVPGGREIAVATSRKMETYNAVIWAHHGLFVSGQDFDSTFGLMHTIEKSAEIWIKVHSGFPGKRQTIPVEGFRALARDFQIVLNEKVLYNKAGTAVNFDRRI